MPEARHPKIMATGVSAGQTVGVAGFEPAAFRSQSGRATKLRHTPLPGRPRRRAAGRSGQARGYPRFAAASRRAPRV